MYEYLGYISSVVLECGIRLDISVVSLTVLYHFVCHVTFHVTFRVTVKIFFGFGVDFSPDLFSIGIQNRRVAARATSVKCFTILTGLPSG